MCQYRAHHLNNPGDESFRSTTCRPKSRRGKSEEDRKNNALERASDGEFCVPFTQYIDAKCPQGQDGVPRLCSDNISLLKEHLASFTKTEAQCVVCKQKTFWKCEKCGGQPCCFKDGGKMNSISCYLDLYDHFYFGLLMHDCREYFGEINKYYSKPLEKELEKNTAHIKQLQLQFRRDFEDK